MHGHKRLASSLVLVVGALFSGVFTYAAGDWNAAQGNFERFKGGYENLRRLTPEETRRVVTAICNCDEDERSSVADDAASRAASEVSSKFNDLERLKNDTIRSLDEVINDAALKDRQSDARTYRDETIRRWETIERMSRSLRGKNHPVVRFLIDEGNRAHKDRQTSSSYCDVYEHGIGSGRADCLRASDCTVIELKPDNDRAIRKGSAQAAGYANALNQSSDERKKLSDRDSKFSKCQTFKWEVWAYKLCPEIDSESNEMRSISTSWNKVAAS